MKKRYRTIGLGGTFDHFHKGHETFLQFAASLADVVLVGVTHTRLTQHKPYADLIEDYQTRVRSIKRFCHSHHITCEIVELTDAVGPTLEGSHVQALCVTPETEPGAVKINELRRNLGLRELPVYIADYFLNEAGKPLHADQIRSGECSRSGIVYGSLFQQDMTLLPPQRDFFQQAQGPLVDEPRVEDFTQTVAVVGDYCLENFITHSWHYDLGIFDLLQQRAAVTSDVLSQLPQTATANNPPGIISLQLIKALKNILQTKQRHLHIKGEEDLAAVALVLLLPLNSQVYYGQPHEGMVCMTVTEKLKEQFYSVLSQKPNLSQN